MELVNTGKSVFVSLVYLEIYECVMFINFTPNAVTKYRVSEKYLQLLGDLYCVRNVVAHGDAREGK